MLLLGEKQPYLFLGGKFIVSFCYLILINGAK